MKLGKLSIEELVQSVENAPKEHKSQAIIDAIQASVDQKYQDVVNEFVTQSQQVSADASLADKFGLRQLSKDEESFIDAAIKQGLTGSDSALFPQTTIEFVFEDLKKNHPLFMHLNWAPAGLKKWILSESTGKAVWGKITSSITSELEAKISDIDLTAAKLTAFSFIPRGIIDLGYKWIDKFMRTILEEALSEGAEEGFITGTGKDSPIGIDRDLKGSVVDEVYPKRTPVAITDFGPESFGKDVLPILNRKGDRNVDKVIVIANQNEIDTRIFKATHVLGPQGYVKAKLPKEFVFVPSKHVEDGQALVLLPKKYNAGFSKVNAESSDQFKFLDHTRTYIIVAYGNGRLVSNDDAVLLDINKLEPLIPSVITQAAETAPTV
ncbi:hypothetical protein [Erysipelothrix anatis]|uniref:hypothetical protein n=1 Tax=Erysipelothrix anatis TaxID=2683713 RepID=UPI0013572D05|nr:hypothetical protein [Erysipelothrix anatis]